MDQLTEQRNDCSSDSQCSLTGQEDVNVGSFNTINQKLDQDNECSVASECKSLANLHLSANEGRDEGDNHFDQTASQTNLCLDHTICDNDAEISDTLDRSVTEGIPVTHAISQDNECRTDSNCQNKGKIDYPSPISADAKINQKNDCAGNSDCLNDGLADVQIEILKQELNQNNECTVDSSCSNKGHAFNQDLGDFVTNDNNDFVRGGDQKMHQSTDCSVESECHNTGELKAVVDCSLFESCEEHQSLEQSDSCHFNSNCENNAVLNVERDDNEDNQVDQKVIQDNDCLIDSECKNVAQAEGGETEQAIEEQMNQKNTCIRDSSCTNNGRVDPTTPTNDQKNLCVNSSDCENTGTNNDSLCVHGSNCNNSGENTKIISVAADCSNDGSGTTKICQGQRTVTLEGNEVDSNRLIDAGSQR